MNLDTRRNLLSVVLIAGIALLILLALVSFLLFGRPDVDAIEATGTSGAVLDRPVARNPELAELSSYATIIERPVFFADRQLPVVELAGAEEAVEEEPEPEPEVEIPELEATVAGIIITPELKLAMITDDSTNETLTLREGMALGGEKSAWKIAEIRARGVQFQTDGGRTEDLELQVETSALKPGAQPRPRTAQQSEQAPDQDAPAEQAGSEDADAQARARAEEIRRRVAERRAQLRAEAERRAREQNDGG